STPRSAVSSAGRRTTSRPRSPWRERSPATGCATPRSTSRPRSSRASGWTRARASRRSTSGSRRRSRSTASCARSRSTATAHWGPEPSARVLDLYERVRLPSIVGFGMGGDEQAIPAAAFAGVYLRARALGLRTSVHAGEWAGAEAVREVLDVLRPDRLDHGIGAAAHPRLLDRLAE